MLSENHQIYLPNYDVQSYRKRQQQLAKQQGGTILEDKLPDDVARLYSFNCKSEVEALLEEHKRLEVAIKDDLITEEHYYFLITGEAT